MEFKIGLVAPSKAGKTTLLASICSEMKRLLEGNAQGIAYNPIDDPTKRAIVKVVSEYETATSSKDGDIFKVPKVGGTQDPYDYRFSFSVPTEKGPSQHLDVWFKDFPGGLLGTQRYAAEIQPFIRESNALVVPIPTDYLMELRLNSGKSDPVCQRRCTAARMTLQINETISAVRDWMKYHTSTGKDGILIFAPVRCEKCFNDNGGERDESDTLYEAVKAEYFDALEMSDADKQCIQVEFHAVDTYGTVEFQSSSLVETRVGDELEMKFRKRLGMGKGIKSKGAFAVLARIANFEMKGYSKKLAIDIDKLEATLKQRNFIEILFALIMGDPKKKLLLGMLKQNVSVVSAMPTIAKISPSDPYRQRIINQM